ncbi:DUF819 domain-containing protein [Longibacter salinarum]|nr:DUF819 family protein [Longibacter salinarum]
MDPVLASPAPLFTDPMTVIAVLASVLAGVFAISSIEKLEPLFKYVPPVIWAYFIPMMLTTLGITPASSPVYDWMSTYLLPFSLFLLMITVDVRAILRLGPRALFMMLVGTLGIVLGAPIAFLIFGGFFSDPVAWKGFAALSGSWIGGTANMLFVKEAVSTPDSTLAPLLVVDVVAGYGWMGILIFLSAYQTKFDNWVGASREVIDKLQGQLEEIETDRVPITLGKFIIILGLGLGATLAAQGLGAELPELGDPTVISQGTWAILIVVTVGLALSFTPARSLETDGASRIGYAALYLLLTSIGASADLKAVLDAPLYLVAGAAWLSVHVALLFGAAIISKSPLFFVATGSMANVGGAASAPIVAGVYVPSLAPVGLLMGVAGYILGVYVALFCAELLRYVHLFLI